MQKGLSIYFDDLEREKAYLKEASELGYTWLFTSFHLPEKGSYQKRRKAIQDVLSFAKKYQYQVIADINRKTLDEFSSSLTDLSVFKDLAVDVLRIDYGFTLEEMLLLSQNKEGLMIQLNASTLSKKDFFKLKKKGLNLKQVMMGHNFYPRKDSGLTWEQFHAKNAFFSAQGLPIMAFIPSDQYHRGPIFEGLPTVEKQRKQGLKQNYLEMLYGSEIDLAMVSEPLLSKEDLDLGKDLAIPLAIEFFPGVSEEEKRIVLSSVHVNREDFNGRLIRSQTSRSYAQKGPKIEARASDCKREFGMVTMDNEAYLRYSGELQICLESFEADPRVNLIGKIAKESFAWLPFIQAGARFVFYEKEV